MLVPILALLGIALFAGGADGWWTRAGRGLVAGIVAAVAAIATVFLLKGHTDWFDWPADSGFDVFVMLLGVLAAIPAMLCCVARAKFRTAFVAGFDLALIGGFLYAGGLDGPTIGISLLVIIGTVIGAAIALRD